MGTSIWVVATEEGTTGERTNVNSRAIHSPPFVVCRDIQGTSVDRYGVVISDEARQECCGVLCCIGSCGSHFFHK